MKYLSALCVAALFAFTGNAVADTHNHLNKRELKGIKVDMDTASSDSAMEEDDDDEGDYEEDYNDGDDVDDGEDDSDEAQEDDESDQDHNADENQDSSDLVNPNTQMQDNEAALTEGLQEEGELMELDEATDGGEVME